MFTKDQIHKIEELLIEMGHQIEVDEKLWYRIRILNPRETIKGPCPLFFQTGYYTLLKDKCLGTIEFPQSYGREDGMYRDAKFDLWAMPKKRSSSFGKRSTGSYNRLRQLVKQWCPVPTAEQYQKAEERNQAQLAANRKVDTKRKLEKFSQQHGQRAMEILLESNVEIPEDFKEAMSEFMDLLQAKESAEAQTNGGNNHA